MFKIIGIKPLERCSDLACKCLKRNHFYPFYANYQCVDGTIVKEIPMVHEDFWTSKGNISIHALVGKNGSGKSAIVELMMRVLNNLAYFRFVDNAEEDYGQLLLVKNVHAVLYYEMNDGIYKVSVENTEHSWMKQIDGHWATVSDNLFPNRFFYSIFNNFSIYAYNSSENTEESDPVFDEKEKPRYWLDLLFEKNDGYTKPVGLNPFRIHGDIQLNRETNLSRRRLLSAFVYYDMIGERFHDDYNLASVKLSINLHRFVEQETKSILLWTDVTGGKNDSRFKVEANEIIDAWDYHCNNQLGLLPKESGNRNNSKYPSLYVVVTHYFVYKTLSIINTYGNIRKIFEKERWKDPTGFWREVVNEIALDSSHIGFKLVELVNFVKNYSNSKYEMGIAISSQDIMDYVRGQLQEGTEKPTLCQVQSNMPPAIFDLDLTLTKKNNHTSKESISVVSSGERQMLMSMSGVVYHLMNLCSISGYGRTVYDNYFVVMEEVELYYHPEYQRQYISDLLKCVKNILPCDKRLDLLVVTHSPFVLSDIPRENVLALKSPGEEDTEYSRETLGANYYDMLKSGFFLESAIGAFVGDKIRRLQEQIAYLGFRDTELESKIEMIGDDFIRHYLQAKYNEKLMNRYVQD